MHTIFIRLFEITLAFLTVLGIGGVGLAAILAFAGALPASPGAPSGAALGVGILVGGAVYLSLMPGLFYVWVGTYRNTKRMADLMERMAA